MKTYRIFLASSSELSNERDLVTAAIADFVSLHPEHKANFQVIKWENFAATFEDARKQDQYNESISFCDVFLMLFWSKVGRYTNEEFDLAQKSLGGNKKPLLLLLEKIDSTSKEDSVTEFKKNVAHGNGLFSAVFKNDDSLKSVIKEELQKLFKDGFLKKGEPAILLSPNGPAEPTVFLGREKELKEIRKRLEKGGKLMLINAEGGIGKTTLAAKYWHESLHEYKHNAWLFCDGGIVNSLKELAPELNVDLSGLDEAQQIKALKLGLKQVHDNFLLVLDNANNEFDIKAFRQEFEGFHWHVLFTSRCQGVIEKELELHIEYLPPPLAKELFERYYKEDNADFDQTLDAVLKAIQYHTLLTEVFAKNLKKAKKLSLKEFLTKLETEGLFLGEDNFEIDHTYSAAKKKNIASTDEILNILYDFSKLEEEERLLLIRMALLPAETYEIDYIENLFTNGSKEQSNGLTKLLADLYHSGWTGGTEDENYRLSPVIQKLVLNKHKKTLGSDAELLLDKLNELLENDGSVFKNLTGQQATYFTRLIPAIGKALKNHQSLALSNLYYNNALSAKILGDRVVEQIALKYFAETIDLLLSIDADNKRYLRAKALSNSLLGDFYLRLGDAKKAEENYSHSLSIFRNLTALDEGNTRWQQDLATSLSIMGDFYILSEKVEEAMKALAEAKTLHEKLLEQEPDNVNYLFDYALDFLRIGMLFKQYQQNNYKEILANGETILKQLCEKVPNDVNYKKHLEMVERLINEKLE